MEQFRGLIVHNNGLFRLIFKPKALHACAERFIKCYISSSEWMTMSQSSTCGPTINEYWIFYQMFDIWCKYHPYFHENHKKNNSNVDGKQRMCRNVTLFDPIINRYFVRESSSKINTSLQLVMKRSNQTHKFLWTTELQLNFPENRSIHGVKRFLQVTETLIKWKVLFSIFLLQLPNTENHVYDWCESHPAIQEVLLTIAPINLFKGLFPHWTARIYL